MNLEALAAWVASLSDGERRELARVARTGHAAELVEATRAARRRDGLPEYRGDAVRRLVAALGGQRRPFSGPADDPWVTIGAALERSGVPGRTLRRWRKSGRVRSRPATVHLGDVERELKR